MGSRVTIVDPADTALDHEDPDVVHLLQRLLEAEGIEFRLGSRVARVAARRPESRCTSRRPGIGMRSGGSHVFVAAGRQPNTDDLGLEAVGVEGLARTGSSRSDERLATSVPGVWAAGDIRGGPMFTHTAWDDFRVLLRSSPATGRGRPTASSPYAVYTDPELGRVGLTEAEARAAGAEVRIGRFEMRNNGKAREIGETKAPSKSSRTPRRTCSSGAAVLATEGAELVHLFVDAHERARARTPCCGTRPHPSDARRSRPERRLRRLE